MAEHNSRLRALFTRLRNAGIRLKMEKCEFGLASLKYLGHIIDANGTRADPTKVRAIVDCPRPQSLNQLRSFLGMVNYYNKFVPNISTVTNVQYDLTKKDYKFIWTAAHQMAFDSLKRALVSDKVLSHYDPTKRLGVSADASAYGVGAVLLNMESNGREKPIYYASRVLFDAEKNYSQIEKEGLAIVFAMRRFQRYLAKQHFILFTDHRPLLKIFGQNETTSTTTSARFQRWSLFLSSFDYEIGFKKSTENANDDALSRNPVDAAERIDSKIAYIQKDYLSDLPIDWRQIRNRSTNDRLLSHATFYTCTGWPNVCPSEEL